MRLHVYSIFTSDLMKTATARADDARISLKHSMVICDQLRGKKLDKAKSFLENLLFKTISLDGKYHPTASKKILEILKAAEANAKVKGLNPDKIFIKQIKGDKSRNFMRPRSRWRLRGRKAKATNILVLLEER